MKNWIANILIKFLLSADKNLKSELFDTLLNNNASIKITNYKKKYQLSDSFKFNGQNIKLYGEGQIIADSNSYIGDYSTIQASENYSVKIGKNCAISHNVRIYTSSNEANQNMNNNAKKSKVFGNVVIGDGTWIGANVFINPLITIGENVIVGANSVVTKNLDNNGIYGGVPARLIRYKE